MSCQLPADCLNEIFEYLSDKKTLHSLLFVNRFSCKVSVRILWENIWKNIWINRINCKQNLRVTSSILSTLVACLPNESKEFLFKKEIFISAPTSKSPLFNYPSFCKVLSIDNICLTINNGLKETPITSLSLKDRNFLVINEIIKMFIIQISSLKKLTFNDYAYLITPNEISTYFSEAIDYLSDLSELHCSLSVPSEFFYHLSKKCHNLHSLTIDMNYKYTENSKFPDELKELISLQNNLKDIKLSAYYEENWTEITQTLTKHSNTLTKLHLNCYCINNLSVSFIASFLNLQEIKFSSGSPIFIERIQFRDFEKLKDVTFPKLQYLSIPYSCTKPEYIIKFLENNGKNLKKFYVKEVNYSLNLSIAKFCPNLKKLSIMCNIELDTLKIIFNSCQYLKNIKIWCGTYWLKEKEILETIAKHSPKNFCKLKIYNCSNSELLLEDLESFFINWNNRELLTLIIINKYSCISLEENEENMKIIEKYKNLGIIKKFEIKNYY
ncbi:hypothetical protein C1645_837269 [Glomus cerebriforme]|uniref:F-box domain-containing protein n=1 Tax=Glomus cerebriforme TaxID=658196 RepID=A0A397SAE6_9GLOM|nr:hypothetical protein C1645_837269 [Glomus cerebriforme]